MNPALTVELQFFLISILSGAILLLVYDIYRILRRVIKHNNFFIALEDLVFWIAASLFIFAMLFKENDGIIRGFAIIGMAIGMVLYHNILSDLIVNLITRLIQALISPFIFVLKKVKSFLLFIWKRVDKVKKIIARRLKKQAKSVKMIMDKKRQTALAKKQKRLAEKAVKKQKQQEIKQAAKQAKKKNSKKTEKKADRKAEPNSLDDARLQKELKPEHKKDMLISASKQSKQSVRIKRI